MSGYGSSGPGGNQQPWPPPQGQPWPPPQGQPWPQQQGQPWAGPQQPPGWQPQPPKPKSSKGGVIALVILALLIIGLISRAFGGGDDGTETGGGTNGGGTNGGGDSVSVDFVMPSVIGMDLQSAQNLMQDNGVFFSTSHDLAGGRAQVVDSNWVVCTQSVPAGQQVTGDVEGQIDFGVVKRGESCP